MEFSRRQLRLYMPFLLFDVVPKLLYLHTNPVIVKSLKMKNFGI